VAKIATIMIAFTIFNLYRLLSPQAAGTRLGLYGKQRFSSVLWMYCYHNLYLLHATASSYTRHHGISCLDYNRYALVHQIEQLDYIRVPHPDATAAVRRADLVFVFGAMDIDEAVARVGILLVYSVEP
jgi:hypothetical protein